MGGLLAHVGPCTNAHGQYQATRHRQKTTDRPTDFSSIESYRNVLQVPAGSKTEKQTYIRGTGTQTRERHAHTSL